MSETPRLRQSLVGMLMRMETHQPGVYREIQLRGRPGAWVVDILKGDQHAAEDFPSPTLLDALTLALRCDLESVVPVPSHNDLFGPLP